MKKSPRVLMLVLAAALLGTLLLGSMGFEVPQAGPSQTAAEPAAAARGLAWVRLVIGIAH